MKKLHKKHDDCVAATQDRTAQRTRTIDAFVLSKNRSQVSKV